MPNGYLAVPSSSVVNAIWPNSPLIGRYPRQQHICPPEGSCSSGDVVMSGNTPAYHTRGRAFDLPMVRIYFPFLSF